MKKVLFLLFATMVVLTSCQKEVVYPTDQLPANVPRVNTDPRVSAWGKFLIVDAKLYVDDHETGVHSVYDHFGPNKDTSSLRWGGSQYDIEIIIKDETTYSFWKPIGSSGYGDFVLNSDTSNHYAVFYVGSYTTIVEDPIYPQQLMGGSSRPFSGQTISYADSTIAIQIQEMEGSINGHNCRYWTQLTLQKIESW